MLVFAIEVVLCVKVHGLYVNKMDDVFGVVVAAEFDAVWPEMLVISILSLVFQQ